MNRDWTPEDIARALEGDEVLAARLESDLTPVIQARVARKLYNRPTSASTAIEDYVQQVWESLLDHRAKVLRDWDPGRGLSLRNYVGLVAERLTISLLRSGRWTGWRENATLLDDPERNSKEPSPEEVTAGRDELRWILERFQEKLDPLDWHLFDLLFVQELPVLEVAERTKMTRWAVYQRRWRIRRLAREVRRQGWQDRSVDANTSMERQGSL